MRKDAAVLQQGRITLAQARDIGSGMTAGGRPARHAAPRQLAASAAQFGVVPAGWQPATRKLQDAPAAPCAGGCGHYGSHQGLECWDPHTRGPKRRRRLACRKH
jgi:hypothetical protein